MAVTTLDLVAAGDNRNEMENLMDNPTFLKSEPWTITMDILSNVKKQ